MARIAYALLLALVCSTMNTSLFAQAAGAPRFDKPRITGAWNRYPEIDETPDAKFPPAPPIPPPPLKPEHKAAWDASQKAAREADARGEPLYGGYAQCLPDGMPAMMMAMFPMEVLETPGQVTIIEEAYNQVRRIYLDQMQVATADAEPTFWGHSVGHWEGDTLVVDTVGVKDYVRFRNVPHSPERRITERIRLLSPDFMEDEVTITDPVYFTGPWKFKWMYKRLPGYKILEYVCEGNRAYKDPETGGTRLRIDHD